MTREEVAKLIRWEWIIWSVGFVNIVAAVPQLYEILTTRNVSGLSLTMFVTYFFIQVAFSMQGYFRRDRMLQVCLGLSALVSLVIIISILVLRG